MELLKERVEYEDSLTIDEYENLSEKIDWDSFAYICDDINILETHLFQLDAGSIGSNLNAIEYIKKYIHKTDWDALSSNPNAIDLLKENKGKINWVGLSCNKNAIDLIGERIKYERTLTQKQYNDLKNKIYWKYLSENPNAIDLFKNNQDKINYHQILLFLKLYNIFIYYY